MSDEDGLFGQRLTRQKAERPGRLLPQVETPPMMSGPIIDPAQGELEFVRYDNDDCHAAFRFDPSNETVWATQQMIADAFGVAPRTVGEHLQNIFRDGELEETAVARKFRATGPDGKNYNYLHYNLEAILSVGYRVSSKRATHFRRWSTKVLKDYITQGFALNEARLRDDPTALRDLAARVRALRADEKNIYVGVRDVFAFGSTDYDAGSQTAKSFFARLQDKFLHAVTGQTSAQLIIDRADSMEPNMGLQNMKGARPTLADAQVGKNYLLDPELYQLHILCEQWLLFVESAAIRGRRMTMAQLAQRFDDLLRLQGHEVFTDYKDYLRDRAKKHAALELDAWRARAATQVTPNSSPAP